MFEFSTYLHTIRIAHSLCYMFPKNPTIFYPILFYHLRTFISMNVHKIYQHKFMVNEFCLLEHEKSTKYSLHRNESNRIEPIMNLWNAIILKLSLNKYTRG